MKEITAYIAAFQTGSYLTSRIAYARITLTEAGLKTLDKLARIAQENQLDLVLRAPPMDLEWCPVTAAEGERLGNDQVAVTAGGDVWFEVDPKYSERIQTRACCIGVLARDFAQTHDPLFYPGGTGDITDDASRRAFIETVKTAEAEEATHG